MKTLYAVTPTGQVLGLAVQMKDLRWRFTRTGGSPGPKSHPTADASLPLSVRQRAVLIAAKDEREASFKARQIPLGLEIEPDGEEGQIDREISGALGLDRKGS